MSQSNVAPRFSALRGLSLLAAVIFPVLAWWLLDNFHACGTQGIEFALIFLLPICAIGIAPAALSSIVLAFIPIRITAKRIAATAGIEIIGVLVFYFTLTIHQAPTGVCSV